MSLQIGQDLLLTLIVTKPGGSHTRF